MFRVPDDSAQNSFRTSEFILLDSGTSIFKVKSLLVHQKVY